MNPYICTARMLSSPSVPARAKPTSGPLSGPSRVLVSVLSVCLAHKSGFSRNRRGTVVVCKARCVRRTSLYLLVYVWIVSSSLESANTSQLLGLLRMRARASEPSSAGGGSGILTSGECCVLKITKKHGDLTLHLHLCYFAKVLQREYFLDLVIMALSWEQKGLGCSLLFESCFKCLNSPWNRQGTPVPFLVAKDLH